jgi:hypothetical protein
VQVTVGRDLLNGTDMVPHAPLYIRRMYRVRPRSAPASLSIRPSSSVGTPKRVAVATLTFLRLIAIPGATGTFLPSGKLV